MLTTTITITRLVTTRTTIQVTTTTMVAMPSTRATTDMINSNNTTIMDIRGKRGTTTTTMETMVIRGTIIIQANRTQSRGAKTRTLKGTQETET